jgi:hypothetical protein
MSYFLSCQHPHQRHQQQHTLKDTGSRLRIAWQVADNRVWFYPGTTGGPFGLHMAKPHWAFCRTVNTSLRLSHGTCVTSDSLMPWGPPLLKQDPGPLFVAPMLSQLMYWI